jgi:hypothetical protein
MQELLNVKAAGTYSDHSALKGSRPPHGIIPLLVAAIKIETIM